MQKVILIKCIFDFNNKNMSEIKESFHIKKLSRDNMREMKVFNNIFFI